MEIVPQYPQTTHQIIVLCRAGEEKGKSKTFSINADKSIKEIRELLKQALS